MPTDAPTGQITVTGRLPTVEWSPALKWGTFLWGKFSDAYQLGDNPTGTITVSGSLAQEKYQPGINYVDRPTGSSTLNGSLVERYAPHYIDSPSGAYTIAGSLSDIRVGTIASTGLITVGGFLRDEANTGLKEGTESVAGTVTVGGSVVEVYVAVHIDSATGNIAVDGSIAAEGISFSDAQTAGLYAVGGVVRSESYTTSHIEIVAVAGTVVIAGSILETHGIPARNDRLVITGVGSTDWAGGTAPAGGVHTGVAQILMIDGTTYIVAHDRAEVLRKVDLHAIAHTAPAWVSFDVPSGAVPIVLNVNEVQEVSEVAPV